MSKRVSKRRGPKRGAKRIPVSVRLYALEQMKLGTDVSALAKSIGVHRSLLYHWQKRSEQGARPGPEVVAMSPEEHRLAQSQARVAELEAAVGRKQLQLDFFQSALRRVETLRESPSASGAKPSTPRSGRGRKANS